MEIDSFVSIHDRNLRALVIEMHKMYHGTNEWDIHTKALKPA